MNETQEIVVDRLKRYEREHGEILKNMEAQAKRKELLDTLIGELKTLLPRNGQTIVPPPQLFSVTPNEFVGKSIPFVMAELLRRTGAPTNFDTLITLALEGGYDGSNKDIDKIRINISSVVSADEKEGGEKQVFKRVGRGIVDLLKRP